MIDWVHSGTADDWPRLPLRGVLVSDCSGLEEWFLETAPTRYNSEARAAVAGDNNLAAGWKLDACVAIVVVGDDAAGIAGASAIAAAIAWVVLNVANFGALWDLAERKDVANVECGGLADLD